MSDESGQDHVDKQEITPKIPKYWTVLYHGTNLARPEWSVESTQQLESGTFVIKGLGLSVISNEDKARDLQKLETLEKQGIAASGFNTTRTYSNWAIGTSKPLEMRIIFPAFNRRNSTVPQAMVYYEARYGHEEAVRIVNLADKVYIVQRAGHPILPIGMELIKLAESNGPSGLRILWYVPGDLLAIYHSELDNE